MMAYNVKVINDIISNEPSRIVSVFKDYLLNDDVNDFLVKLYKLHEIKEKLVYITDYYNKY